MILLPLQTSCSVKKQIFSLSHCFFGAMRGRNDIFDTDIQKIGNFARNCIFEGDFLIFSPIRTCYSSQVAFSKAGDSENLTNHLISSLFLIVCKGGVRPQPPADCLLNKHYAETPKIRGLRNQGNIMQRHHKYEDTEIRESLKRHQK